MRWTPKAAPALDAESRTCVIDAGTAVGFDLNRLFVGFVRREFGEDAFRVQRVDHRPGDPAKNERTDSL